MIRAASGTGERSVRSRMRQSSVLCSQPDIATKSINSHGLVCRFSSCVAGPQRVLLKEISGETIHATAPIQKTLNESLAAITRSLEGSRSLGGLLFVMLVSLVYGMFHAAGPGHGKTIVASFFLPLQGDRPAHGQGKAAARADLRDTPGTQGRIAQARADQEALRGRPRRLP